MSESKQEILDEVTAMVQTEQKGDIRVHGNGFIQMDLALGRRLHVWGHPDIPRQRVATPIHDHAFGFASTILVGRIVDVRYDLELTSFDWDHSVFSPRVRVGEDTILEDTGTCGRLEIREAACYDVGTVYGCPIGDLHETFTSGPAATVITKLDRAPVNYRPSVLVPRGQKPDNDFIRYEITAQKLWEIVQEVLS